MTADYPYQAIHASCQNNSISTTGGIMSAFLVKRLGFAIITLWAVLTLVFIVVRIVPGDPAQVILGDQADATAIAALRIRLGLDRSITEQYWSFLFGAAQGDWGVSLVTGRPVIREILSVLP